MPVALATPQPRRRVDPQQRAAHDPDPVAEALRLVEVVRADHDRAAGVAQRGDEVANRLGGRRVEGARRLVEVEHLGLVEERAGDGHLLAHALAEAADAPVALVGQADHAEVSVDRSPQVRAAQPVQAPVVAQVLARRELVVEAGGLGQDAGDGADALRVASRARGR